MLPSSSVSNNLVSGRFSELDAASAQRVAHPSIVEKGAVHNSQMSSAPLTFAEGCTNSATECSRVQRQVVQVKQAYSVAHCGAGPGAEAQCFPQE